MILKNKKYRQCNLETLQGCIAVFVFLIPLSGHSIASPLTLSDKDISNGLKSGPEKKQMLVGPEQNEDQLYLEIEINRSSQTQLMPVLHQNEHFYISVDDFRNLGLSQQPQDQVSETGLLALDQLAEFKIIYEEANQKLKINVPVSRLKKQYISTKQQVSPAQVNPEQDRIGVALNYNIFAQQSDDYKQANSWQEMRIFGLGHGGLLRINSAWNYNDNVQQNSQSKFTVFDTVWQKDFVNSMLSLKVGDINTNTLDWTRSVRLGGIQLSKNFSLQPYRSTVPQASFVGSAVLPSTVDLLINGLKQSSQQVQPGQFQIDTTPSISGLGQAQLVITDITGQQQVLDYALYGSTELLEEKLSDWSVSLGNIHQNYGEQSFEYDNDTVFSGDYRYGLTNNNTLELHGEFAPQVQMLGAGWMQRLGPKMGIFSASMATSQSEQESGWQYDLNYRWNSQWLSFYAATRQRNESFKDISSLASNSANARTDQLYVSMNTRTGLWGMGYVNQTYHNEEIDPNRYVLFNWNYNRFKYARFSTSLNYNVINQDKSIVFSMNVPLGRNTVAGVSLQKAESYESAQIDINHSIVNDMGWGWRVQSDLKQSNNGQAQVNYMGRYGEVQLGVQSTGKKSDVVTYAGLNGALVSMKDNLHFTRRVEDAFGIVSTGGVADIPVFLENQFVGNTDRNGKILLSRLNAYQHNKVEIKAKDIPIDIRVTQTEIDAVPRSYSGIFIEFPTEKIYSIQLHLKNTAGQDIEAGSGIWLTPELLGEPYSVVGRDGVVYLENPPDNAVFYIGLNQQNSCRFHLPVLPKQDGFMNLGVVTCVVQ